MVAAGCQGPSGPVSTEQEQKVGAPDEAGNSGGTSDGFAHLCRRVTVSGDLYYNDQRTYGRFPIHKTPAGANGRQYKLLDSEVAGDATHTDNYLSLIDATVEIYEIDRATGGSSYCETSTYVDSVTTDVAGHFTWTGDVCDSCGVDDASDETNNSGQLGVSIGLRTVLRFCGEGNARCISVREPPAHAEQPDFDEHDEGATLYALWHRDASPSAPRRVFVDNASARIPDGYFEQDGDFTDKYLQAAFVYQGLVEAARKLHVTLGVPFRRSTFGEVTAIYPMTWPGHGAGHSHEQKGNDNADSFCIPAPGSEDETKPSGDSRIPTGWGAHKTEFHEYGHLINYRAWEGYGKYVNYHFDGCNKDPDGDGIDDVEDCSAEMNNEEFAAAAFKEPWANFMRRVVLNELEPNVDTRDYLGCTYWEPSGNTEIDWDNEDDAAASICTGGVPCDRGERSPQAVEHSLCDLFDNHVDDTALSTFVGEDTLGNETLTGIITDLENAWRNGVASRRDAYISASGNGEAVKGGFGICELARQRVVRVPGDRTDVDHLLRLNGILCPL